MKPSRPTIPTPQPREEAVQAAVQAATLAFHRREAARPWPPWNFSASRATSSGSGGGPAGRGAPAAVVGPPIRLAAPPGRPSGAMGTLAPLFVVLVLPQLWKNRANGALEVECTAYYSLRQVYAARLVLFGLADLALLTGFFSVALLTGRATWEGLILHFLLPFLVTGCICLRTPCPAAWMGAVYAALPLSLVWTAVWVCILLNDPVYQLISRPVWLGMLVLAVYFCYAIGKLQTHCETLWEGTTSWL